MEFLKSVDSEWYKQRLTGVMLLVLMVFVLLFARLFYLQIIKGKEFRRLSENNSIRLQIIDAPRGQIFDRNGKLLVDNRPSFDLSIILNDAKPLERVLQKLSIYTGIPETELKKTIQKEKCSPYQPILLKRDIGRNALAAVEVHKLDLPGITVDVKPQRHYLNKKSAAHFIGYLGEINPHELKSKRYQGCKRGDLIGKFGAERTLDRFLRGKNGGRQVEVNVSGQVVRVLKTVNAKQGQNVYLTMDSVLQQKAEELLKGKAGAAIAMEPETGHILALTSSPSFDPKSFVGGISRQKWDSLISNPQRPMENKAIQGEYPPASTYKIITAIAGLEEEVVDESKKFFCPGYFTYGGHTFRCWKKSGHGYVNIVKAIEVSCDVFFYNVGRRLGVDRLAWYAKACGLGSRTKISLEGEDDGLIPTAAWKKRRTGIPWQGGETISIAIGQGYNLVTPIQMLLLTSGVANGGVLYKPMIFKEIRSTSGKLIRKGKIKVIGRIPASVKTMELIKRGLWNVVNGTRGTARGSRIYGIEMCGKTGTAQIIGRKDGDKEYEKKIASQFRPHAWFVAYAPSDNPKIAVSVIVEHGEHGSSAAAPIAREMIKTYLSDQKTDVDKTVVGELDR
jgi:penicillin-binding protein 2